MRLGVLGPLLVVDEGREFRVGAARQRILLAALMVRANRIVPIDELVEIVWDGAPTPRAAGTLRSYVARLRQIVGVGVAARILTRDPGYLCQLADDESDIQRFESACRQAAVAARSGRWEDVSAVATDALDLWRGDPLVDVPSELLRGQVVPRLEQFRLQALEDRAEADLRLGSRENLVPQLRELTAAYPLRERFHAQLMRVLAGTGQHAEALAAYRDARRTLRKELGIEPGSELRELHEKILANDPTLATPTGGNAALEVMAAPAVAVVPRQLPAGVRHFTGRTAELKMLTTLLGPAGCDGDAVAISLIDGTAGVGKTALAVQWAHQHAGLFPDGQLYVNLQGFDPAGPPMTAATAVRRILDALTVPVAGVPADTDAQFDLYRSLVADRRLLIVLDNARDAEQVRPLLPGAVGCRVLVTSRNRLTSLIALDGAIPLTIDLLTTQEARELLIRRLGSERVAGEDHAADELIDACARLPLALNIAAANVATHPMARLATVAAQLRDAHRRLDLLSTGHAAGDLRAVFSWSYRALSEPAAHLFGLLGVHPGPDLTLPAAASLAGRDRDQTRDAVDELSAAHLLIEHVPGRYTLHDLLRAYATEQAARPCPPKPGPPRCAVWSTSTCTPPTPATDCCSRSAIPSGSIHRPRVAFRTRRPTWPGQWPGSAPNTHAYSPRSGSA